MIAKKVFISYRRDDSAPAAGRVHDRLEREFGRDLLFMDVDAIPLGVNFAKVLSEEVGKCDALLAIIGPGWLDARDKDGKRRLDSAEDFVRVEIAAALQRDIPVIPILLEGTPVPGQDQLPDDIKELALRNGLDVRHASFHSDMDKLVRGLRSPMPQPVTPAPAPAPTSISPANAPADAKRIRRLAANAEPVARTSAPVQPKQGAQPASLDESSEPVRRGSFGWVGSAFAVLVIAGAGFVFAVLLIALVAIMSPQSIRKSIDQNISSILLGSWAFVTSILILLWHRLRRRG